MYWVWDPVRQKRVRVKEKVAHIKEGRARWVQQRIRELNGRLALGWNPLMERMAPRAAVPVHQAITEFIEAKTRDGLSEDSLRSYLSMAKRLHTWLATHHLLELSVGEFGDELAVRYMDDQWRRGGISARTYNNILIFCSSLGNWWRRHKYIQRNPWHDVERKNVDPWARRRRPLTDDERARVRAYMEQHMPRFFEFSLIMFHCGLRPKEAFLLKPEHFDLERWCIRLTPDMTKTNRSRVVAIPDVFRPMVERLNIPQQKPEHYVFSTKFYPGSVRKDSRYSGKWWARVRKELGLDPSVQHYSIRHTAVLQLARDQVSRLDAQAHFGHVSSKIHDLYGLYMAPEGNDVVRKKSSAF